jgi:xylono-1,5-lactonase
MTPTPGQPEIAAAIGAELGEGPLWDHRLGILWFVDILRHRVWRFDPRDGSTAHRDVGETVGFVGLTSDRNRLVVGLRSGLALLSWSDGSLVALASPEPDLPGNRINDGIVGPDGSVWFGSMDLDARKPTGRFWRWKDGTLASFGHAMACTNGPTLSADGKTLYCADTMDRAIHRCDVTAVSFGAFEPFFRFTDENLGYVDGIITDAEDHIWIAHWAGSRLTRVTPTGKVAGTIVMPTMNITKCAFGGPDLTTLYATSAATGIAPGSNRNAGHLFRIATSWRGLPASVLEL